MTILIGPIISSWLLQKRLRDLSNLNGATALPVLKASNPNRALITRAAAAVVLAVPVLAAVYVGSPVFEIMVCTAALAMTWEWRRMCAGGAPVGTTIALGLTLVASIAATALPEPGWALAVLAAGTVLVFIASKRHTWLSAGSLYVGLPCVAIVWLRNDPAAGRETVFWLLALVWASDIGAYASGRLLGGPKLVPAVSPNKTWAGLFGAVASAGLVGFLTALILGPPNEWRLASVSAALGMMSQAGDLLESWIKRRFGVKDTGTLIPGHGGMLDRVDGLVAATVIVALITAIAKGSMLTWL